MLLWFLTGTLSLTCKHYFLCPEWALLLYGRDILFLMTLTVCE